MINPANLSETKILKHLNSLDPNLKFSIETEIQEKLDFLGVTIRKENNKIINKLVLNILNFTDLNSFGFKTLKINRLKTMIKLLKIIFSDESTLKKDIEEPRSMITEVIM